MPLRLKRMNFNNLISEEIEVFVRCFLGAVLPHLVINFMASLGILIITDVSVQEESVQWHFYYASKKGREKHNG